MSMMELECFGGPLDGQKMPVPGEPETACGCAVDRQTGEPHFYMLSVRWTFEGLEERRLTYCGNDAERVLSRLRDTNPDLAAQLEESLEQMRRDQSESEFDTDDD